MRAKSSAAIMCCRREGEELRVQAGIGILKIGFAGAGGRYRSIANFLHDSIGGLR